MKKHEKQAIEPVQLIDKANDVSAFASTEPTRPVLSGVYANGKGTEATDGRIVIRVPYVSIDPEEFPSVENVTSERKPAILPIKSLQEALKSVHKCNLPVLGCVRLSTVERGETTKAQFATTDLENNRVIESRVIAGDYPNIDQVWPVAEPTLTIALGASYLRRIAEYALKHANRKGQASIKFLFTDGLSPVRFELGLDDGRKAEGGLMPMRLS